MNPELPQSQVDLRVVGFLKSGEDQLAATEQAPGIFESRGLTNSYLLTTPDGNVLVNAGTLRDARRGHGLFKKVSPAPIRRIVLTQSHANQYGGLEVYKSPDNRVIAHRLYAAERRYCQALHAHYSRGSRRIFGSVTGKSEDLVPTQEIAPDLLIDDGHRFELGGRRFELVWTPGGETRSAIIVWLPEEKVALVGNLFGPLFGNHPNLNTLRGDKPRSALEFVASVRAVRALEPAILLTGHEAVRGADHIRRELTRIIDSVQWVHDRTVEGMNEGKSLRTLMREVRPPRDLALAEEYGKVPWNVRAIWHEYTGWFDPTRGTTELYGFEPSSVAPAIVDLAGGISSIAARAQVFLQEGKPIEALHLLEIAAAAVPHSDVVRQVMREALKALLRQSEGKNFWERMWLTAEIKELEDPGEPAEP